jgi:hypothetical protein
MNKIKKLKLTSQTVSYISVEQIIDICRMKHYRQEIEGMGNYDRLRRLLTELGLDNDQIKQCLNP